MTLLLRVIMVFHLGASLRIGAYFGSGSGPIHLDYVVCSGTEYDLMDCQTGNETRQSSHSEDVGVKCQTSKERLCTCIACHYTVYVLLERMSHTQISL